MIRCGGGRKSGSSNNYGTSMETTRNIHQRLLAVMQAVSYVQKGDKTVNNQYRFVSHDAVAAKVRPALIANGIVPTVTVKAYRQDGNRTEATLIVRFVNSDSPTDFVEVESFGYGIDPQDKGPGKAVSYAFKYALLKTLCLETGDDPERDNIEHESRSTIIRRASENAIGIEKVNKLVPDRSTIIRCAAENAIARFANDDEVGAYEEISGIDDNEERLELWAHLRPHSALRAYIKKQWAKERAEMDATPVKEAA